MTQQTNTSSNPASKSKTTIIQPRKTIFQTNFDKLKKLGVINQDNSIPVYARSKSEGYMDLVVEALPHLDGFKGDAWLAFSMAHYFVQNGDLCRDPDLVILCHPGLNMVEVYSFQQDIPPLYQEVYPNANQFYLKLRKELNSFLRTWLTNLINQNHGKAWFIK
jgi:hypothetical protein